MAVFMDIKGTSQSLFQIGKYGPKLKNGVSEIQVRDIGDANYLSMTALHFFTMGDSLFMNFGAVGGGSDWSYAITRPTSGMTAAVTLTLPPDAGTNGYVLQTNGSGVLSWVAQSSPPSVTSKITVDTTTLAFGASSPVSMFTLPANAVVLKVAVIIDTVFDGNPTLSIGISGTTAKYMAIIDNDLLSGAGDRWESNPNNAAVGTTEAIIATYSAGSATQGSARILVEYSIPE